QRKSNGVGPGKGKTKPLSLVPPRRRRPSPGATYGQLRSGTCGKEGSAAGFGSICGSVCQAGRSLPSSSHPEPAAGRRGRESLHGLPPFVGTSLAVQKTDHYQSEDSSRRGREEDSTGVPGGQPSRRLRSPPSP